MENFIKLSTGKIRRSNPTAVDLIKFLFTINDPKYNYDDLKYALDHNLDYDYGKFDNTSSISFEEQDKVEIWLDEHWNSNEEINVLKNKLINETLGYKFRSVTNCILQYFVIEGSHLPLAQKLLEVNYP